MTEAKKNIMFALAFLTLVCIFLLTDTYLDSNSAEAAPEQPSVATTAETTEVIQEPTETETPTTEATEMSLLLYDVPLDSDLQLYIIEQAETHGIDPAIIFAMAYKESTYRAGAIGDGGNSFGLLQIQPRWHSARMEKLGCPDLLDPYQNVTVAIDYLYELLNRYEWEMPMALTAYNRGHYAGTVTQYAIDVIEKAEEIEVIK